MTNLVRTRWARHSEWIKVQSQITPAIYYVIFTLNSPVRANSTVHYVPAKVTGPDLQAMEGAIRMMETDPNLHARNSRALGSALVPR